MAELVEQVELDQLVQLVLPVQQDQWAQPAALDLKVSKAAVVWFYL